MAQKQKKNQKFGRNSRSNSSKLQSQRTARNKRLRIEAAGREHGKNAVGHVCPKHPSIEQPENKPTMTHDLREAEFGGVKAVWRGDCWRERGSLVPLAGKPRLVVKQGVTVDVRHA